MKRFNQTLLTFSLAILLIGTVLAPAALAQDADDLKAAVMDFYEKLNNEDPGFTAYFMPGGVTFPRTGSLLTPSNTDVNVARANFDAGTNFDVQVHHLDATVHGNSAVVTYYTTGTTTYRFWKYSEISCQT